MVLRPREFRTRETERTKVENGVRVKVEAIMTEGQTILFRIMEYFKKEERRRKGKVRKEEPL